MSKIKHFIQQSWLLIVSSFCFGLLIAVANAAWSPRILQNEKEKLQDLMTGLIIDANDFKIVIKDVNIPGDKGRLTKTDVYKARDDTGKTVGFAFIAVGSGFADKIKLVIAVDNKCEKFSGFDVLASNETPGFGDKIKSDDDFRNQFGNIPAGKLELIKTGKTKNTEIIAITGATISSEAVVNIFNAYIDHVKEQLQAKGLTSNGG